MPANTWARQTCQEELEGLKATGVVLGYDVDSRLTDINRYASTSTTNIVADSKYSYDDVGRLTSIVHTGDASGSTYSNEYDYGYDDASRLTSYSNTLDGISTDYSYDKDGQLTSADYTGGGTDESYTYTANGNRSVVHDYNGELDYDLVDGDRYSEDTQYIYGYDPEGNLISKLSFGDDSGDVLQYKWDNRNRLVEVDKYDGHGTYGTGDNTLEEVITYRYDAFNQLVYRQDVVEGGSTTQTVFINDGGQVVLEFDKSGTGSLAASDLGHRYLWNPQAVDQLLADEQVQSLTSAASNEVLWAMTDNLGSVRDMIDSAGTLRLHRMFDSFGNVTSETHYDASGATVTSGTGYLDEAFEYTGKWFDRATGLQNNLNRWYDSFQGRFISEDPSGFGGGDTNLYRYVGNQPTDFNDPSGRQIAIGSDGKPIDPGSLRLPGSPNLQPPGQMPPGGGIFPVPPPLPRGPQGPSIGAMPKPGTSANSSYQLYLGAQQEDDRLRKWLGFSPPGKVGGYGAVKQGQAIRDCEGLGRLSNEPPPAGAGID